MSGAKIQLSPAEERLMANAEVILTKNRVVEKMRRLLEGVQVDMEKHHATFSKPHVFAVPPKISRGENYLGLPYLVLDYPRLFQQSGVFAIRSFFWWGKFFSSTLHLSGVYKETYLPRIEAAFSTFSKHHIGINADPWLHHFETENYTVIGDRPYGDFKKLVPHLKLAVKLPVEDWPNAAAFLFDNWNVYLNTVL